MNWKRHLFKPKWQHKSADIRLEAVTTEQHPELINNLLDIAAADEDSRVRCAAIKRLHQLGNVLKLHSSETDQTVRKLLEERIRQLASSSNESRPPLEFRMQVAETTSDRDLIEHLASHAPENELRLAALARVERQGVLGDCCIQDNNAENRRFAASRITQQTTLKRVIDELRKRDKSLYAELQERLHEELLEQDDRKAVQTEALRICSALEKQSLNTDHKDTREIEIMHTAWQRIADKARNDMVQRYQRACERLVAPAVVSPAAEIISKADSVPEPEPVKKPTPEVVESQHANKSLAKTASAICLYESENSLLPNAKRIDKLRTQLEKAWNQCTPPHPEDQLRRDEANTALAAMQAKLELQILQNEKDLGQAQDLLTQLETELEQGELHKALETRARLQQTTKERGRSKDWQKINSKLSGMQARLRELRDWHHWSNNKVRKRLIAEMEVLPAAELHPDALLDRIKSLQLEWKKLEQSEQIPGDKKFVAAPWMWRKFSAAGHTAFDTAKPYLDKRSEIQSRHVQSLSEFCTELEELAAAEPADWSALGKGMTEGRKKLHDLNNLPASQRQKMAKQLKAALDKANSAVQAHYEVVEREKMKLIRAASQLIHMAERSEAIAQAKSLQSNWKAAGSLWRSKEQELWNQFREHLDPLFNELKEEQASIRAADHERLSTQKALCTELREILNNEQDLPALHGKVQGLQDSWKEIQHPDRKLLQSFQDMVVEYEQQVDQAGLQKVEKDRERWWLKSELLHELSVNGRTQKGTISKIAEKKVNKAWPQDSSASSLEREMDQACQEILAGNIAALDENETGDLTTRARVLCIGLEFIAGLPSPDEDRDQRMKYQVDRLAESMSGESIRQPVSEEALAAEKTWLSMYQLPEADFKAFGKRVKQALSAINRSV